MIRLRGVTKSYGDQRVLDGLDLRVERGERVALLGPNGAGKTTLFRCMLGTADFQGRVEIDGVDVDERGKEARARTGYVPQSAPRYDLTLRQFVGLFSDLRGIDPAEPATRLEELGLSLDRDGGKRLGELSGGMLQKSVLALALGAGAPLLLLDEPTASLDPASRREFLKAVRGADGERTLFFASHRFDEIEPLADRIVVLDRGRFAFDGTPSEFWSEAGGGVTLWLSVPEEERRGVARRLQDAGPVRDVRANGTGLEVELDHSGELEFLAEVRERGLPVDRIQWRPPEAEELMSRILGGRRESGR